MPNATWKKMTKENKKKSIYSPLGASNHSNYERIEQDYYATHPSAIDYLFEKERFSEDIWEPACGQGHLSKRMEEHRKNVYSTDLINRGYGDDFFDFLHSNKKWKGDIITNPPYKLAKEFVVKSIESIEVGHKVAMFLKLTFLESRDRVELFENYPPKRVWVFSFRIPVARNGESEMFLESSAVCYAWFVWEKGFGGRPELGWISKKKTQDNLF